MIASFIPEVAPDNANFWRIVLGVPAIVIGLITIPLSRRLSRSRFQLFLELSMAPALAINVVILQITPATEAVLFNLIVTLIFASYFLRRTALTITLASFVCVALSTLFTDPAAQTEYLGSFLVVYVATIGLTVVLMHMQNGELLSALGRVRRHADTDPLTGLANLRALEDAADLIFSKHELRRHRDEVIGVLLIDLDNFKAANTKHGHLGGDYALRAIAEQLRRVAPSDSILARVGGDEFAVLMRAHSRKQVDDAGEMFRAGVRAADALIEMPGVKIGAAVGVATFPEDGQNLSELLGVADKAMYEQKGAKRHTVPNLERVPTRFTERPPWLTDETDHTPSEAVRALSDEAERLRGLDRVTGGSLPLLRTREPYARAATAGWLVGTTILAVSLLMPDAYPDPRLTWWMVMICGIVPIPVMLSLNAPPRSLIHIGYDLIAFVALIVAIAGTGGIDSVAAPLLVLHIANMAWFWEDRALAFRALAPLVVAASPLAYTEITNSQSEVIDLVRIYMTCWMAITLVGAMYVNRFILLRLQGEAEQLATRDPLTAVSNRRAFNNYVQDRIAASSCRQFAIVMIDLDNFKRVNTEGGHRDGDRVLQAIASSLARAAREDDCMARIGGDEFAAVLPGVGVDDARALAERFVQAVSETPEAERYDVGASAGFALWPIHGATLDELMFTADGALMTVKASGKGSAQLAQIVSAVH